MSPAAPAPATRTVATVTTGVLYAWRPGAGRDVRVTIPAGSDVTVMMRPNILWGVIYGGRTMSTPGRYVITATA